MNGFFKAVFGTLGALLLLVLLVGAVIGVYKLYYYEPSQIAAPPAANTPVAQTEDDPRPLAGGPYVEQDEPKAPSLFGLSRKPALKAGGGGQACNGQEISAGNFTPDHDTIVIVRETDKRGGQRAFIGYWHVERVTAGSTLKVGKGVAANGGDRAAWSVTCNLDSAIADAYRSALQDLQGEWYGAAWMQIECSSLVEEIGATYNVQDMGGIAGGNHFVEVVPGYPEKYLVVCEAGGAPEAPAEPAAPAQPAAPAAGGSCDTSVTRGTPVYPGEIVPSGTVVVYEVVDYVAHTITVRGMVLTTDTKAGATAENANVHINMWIGFCHVSDAVFDAAGQAEERRMDALKAGSWNEGWTDITFIR